MSNRFPRLWVARLLLLALLCGMSSLGFGQPSAGIGWATETLPSRVLGPRTIYIATPEGYGDGRSRYPVLVLLDANDHAMFRLWIAQAAYLSGNSRGFPPLITVGIVNGADRIHDMTPPATGSSMKEFKTAGGASAFADFLLDEVLPFVRAKYRTLPGTFLTGHSAGGLFAIDVASRRPSAFHGVIATSPALWFNDGALVDAYADSMGRSKLHPRLFFAAGNEGDLSAAVQRFADRLGTQASQRDTFAYRALPNATHQLTPMVVGEGLQFLFDPVSIQHLAIEHLDFAKVDGPALQEALQASEQGYAAAARSLGLSTALPENVLNGLGYRLLGHRKADLAITVFQRNVQAYPDSVNVYDSLADGFLAAGDKATALVQLRRAVEVGRRTGAPVADETRQKLKDLEAQK